MSVSAFDASRTQGTVRINVSSALVILWLERKSQFSFIFIFKMYVFIFSI